MGVVGILRPHARRSIPTTPINLVLSDQAHRTRPTSHKFQSETFSVNTVADRCRKATFKAPGSPVRGTVRIFDLKTGAVLGPPAQKGVPSYKVVVEGDDIKVEV